MSLATKTSTEFVLPSGLEPENRLVNVTPELDLLAWGSDCSASNASKFAKVAVDDRTIKAIMRRWSRPRYVTHCAGWALGRARHGVCNLVKRECQWCRLRRVAILSIGWLRVILYPMISVPHHHGIRPGLVGHHQHLTAPSLSYSA